MAQKEDIRDRVRRVNPRAQAILDEVDKQIARLGGGSVAVTTTEDMTDEEKEMALFEGYLKEGYPIEVAATKAKEFLALTKRLFPSES